AGTQQGRQIETAQPQAAPPWPKDDELRGPPLRRGPQALVRLVPPQEIELPVAALDRAADHHRHEDDTDTLVLPAWVATALVKMDRVAVGEAVPRRPGGAVQLDGRQPQPATSGQLADKRAVRSVHLRIVEHPGADPALTMEGDELSPTFLQSFHAVVGDGDGVI